MEALNNMYEDREKRYEFLINKNERGRLTNIDYELDFIYAELKKTNKLIEQQTMAIETQTKVNSLLLRLIEHMLEKSDNPDVMREYVRMEMARGLR